MVLATPKTGCYFQDCNTLRAIPAGFFGADKTKEIIMLLHGTLKINQVENAMVEQNLKP